MCCWVITVNTNGLTRVPGLRVGHYTDQKTRGLGSIPAVMELGKGKAQET